MRRRTVLATLSGATTTALAGCSDLVGVNAYSCSTGQEESPTKDGISISDMEISSDELTIESSLDKQTSVSKITLVHNDDVVAETTDISAGGTTALTWSEADLSGENTITVRFKNDGGETIDQAKIAAEC